MFETTDYEPLPIQKFEIGDKKYNYEFEQLTFEQVMLAEELANYKQEQLGDNPDSYYKVEKSGMDRYKLKLAALLLSPDAKPWSSSLLLEIESDLAKIPNDGSVERLEQCLVDFLNRRGKRMLASETVMRDGSLTQMFTMLAKAGNAMLSSQPSATADFTTAGNSTADGMSEPEIT